MAKPIDKQYLRTTSTSATLQAGHKAGIADSVLSSSWHNSTAPILSSDRQGHPYGFAGFILSQHKNNIIHDTWGVMMLSEREHQTITFR